jgi:hypothetical protein
MNICYGHIFGKGREKWVVECNKSYITLKKGTLSNPNLLLYFK